MQWRIIPDIELHWFSWGDEFSVYQSGSGDTHLVDLTTAGVIKALEQNPRTSMGTDEVARNIAAAESVEYDHEWALYIEQVLESLHQLNIIERVVT